MIIDFHKYFNKRYEKLNPNIQNKIDIAIEKFRKDPFDPILKNHPLKGLMRGRRSFSVTGDIRIIFEEYDNYVLVVFLYLGTHNQVYF